MSNTIKRNKKSEKGKSKNRHEVSRLDKIVGNQLRLNDLLLLDSIVDSISSVSDSSVDGTEDVPKPLTVVNIHKSKLDFAVVHSNLSVLVDPGSTHSIIKRTFVEGIRHRSMRKKRTSYKVAGGEFQTKYEAKVGFSLTEFSHNSIIRHRFAIDDGYGDEGIGYDMIIGQDLCNLLGININYEDCTIEMDGMAVAMKDSSFPIRGGKSNKARINKIFSQSAKPKATAEATDRIMRILDSNYHKADLNQVVAKASLLNTEQKQKLLALLKKYESIFDGTLGRWNTEPIEIELREGAKPISSKYYPVPKIHKATFRKELFRLVDIDVLTPVQQSE